jgi:hypothetical protein
MSETPDPYREAVLSVLPDDLKGELAKAEEQYGRNLQEALVSKGRVAEQIRERKDRPFEHLEAELEKEHAELVRYHTRRFVKSVRWILEAWRNTPEE